MDKTFPTVLGVLALLATPLAADARGEGRAMLPSFETLDRDGTGTLTLEDFQAGLQERRSAVAERIIVRLMEHADEDGKLDEAGLRAGFAALAEERRAAWRQTRAHLEDGRAEFGARMFSRIDRNDDGVIDSEEYESFIARMTERMERHRPRDRGRWGQRGRE